MSEHTPGPWYVSLYEDYTEIWKDYGDGRVHIATADDGWMEARANARLIAAAPELLEALEIIAGHESGWDSDAETVAEFISIARAALQEGEG